MVYLHVSSKLLTTDLVLGVDEEVYGSAWLLPDDGDAVALLELVEVASVVVDDGGAVVHDAVARHHPRARAQVRHRRREVKVVRRVRRHAFRSGQEKESRFFI